MHEKFKGRVAMITGSSYGIGQATAIEFARRGCRVVLADWVEDSETLDSVRNLGAEAIFVRCDVSNEEDLSLPR
jgi:NAD(P)-dependent dehydrogenase (short-subunit alcohol dehydrogenase family)